MSKRQELELRELMTRVASEAAGRERHRCLWILERLLQQASKGLENKLLAAGELQLVKVRFELTKSIVTAVKALILSGARPPVATATPAPGQGEPPANPHSEIVIP